MVYFGFPSRDSFHVRGECGLTKVHRLVKRNLKFYPLCLSLQQLFTAIEGTFVSAWVSELTFSHYSRAGRFDLVKRIGKESTILSSARSVDTEGPRKPYTGVCSNLYSNDIAVIVGQGKN
ncbi:hypothetical protein RRG08_047768 [Elysia crispata]|uniref:Uncharacterized protein n=1 Tax=Elysia crispata TaxID=231223 RepID=A0AAE0YX29_9GAST|nr:hypothetical protein RRG08_047768 [Elysia crispata]